MIQDNLLRFKKDQIYYTLDGESENLCLLANNHGWEWGFSKNTLNKELDKGNIWIKRPNLKVGAEAARITRYYDKVGLVEKYGISAKEAHDKIAANLYNKDYIILTQNGLNFDVYLWNLLRKEIGLPSDHSFIYRMIDTSLLAKAHKIGATIPKFGTDDFLSFMYQMANTPIKGVKTNLRQLCKDADIEYDEFSAHQGDYDCLKTFEVFSKDLVWKVEI